MAYIVALVPLILGILTVQYDSWISATAARRKWILLGSGLFSAIFSAVGVYEGEHGNAIILGSITGGTSWGYVLPAQTTTNPDITTLGMCNEGKEFPLRDVRVAIWDDQTNQLSSYSIGTIGPHSCWDVPAQLVMHDRSKVQKFSISIGADNGPVAQEEMSARWISDPKIAFGGGWDINYEVLRTDANGKTTIVKRSTN